MNKDFKKFIIRGSLFGLPFVLFFGISFYVLSVSGELTNLDSIINMDPPFVAGMSYTDPLRYLKINTILKRSPQIIIMGSSRTARWRSQFFNPSEIFYNAHIGGMQLEDFNIFLNKIPPDKQPKIIFMGLDQDYFNEYICPFNEPAAIKNLQIQYTTGRSNSFLAWKYGYLRVYSDLYLHKKFRMADLKHRDNNKIGLNAIINGDGILYDGSFLTNKFINNLITDKDRDVKAEFITEYESSNKTKTFCSGKREWALSEVSKFLDKSKTRNINIIGFITPYARAVIDNLDSTDKNYETLLTAPLELESLFKKHGFAFYNFSDISRNIGKIRDEEMINATHGSEKTDLRIFIYILEREPQLKGYANSNYLKKLLRESKGDFLIFDTF